MADIRIIGAGLSGCEAALQAADRGLRVDLYEMRPLKNTGAHKTDGFAELVCSNSLGSELPSRSSGLLMLELEMLGSHLINIAKKCRIPAGHALAIDRNLFSNLVTQHIKAHPNIRVIRKEITKIPAGKVIIASGPLTSEALVKSIQTLTNKANLFFYDAIAPIIDFNTINMNIAFWGSRYGKGFNKKGDYINCPFKELEYTEFVRHLVNAERIRLKDFEKNINSGVRAGKSAFFEGCLPIEVMAARGKKTLAFGPLRPVGLTNPHTDEKPYAVVQLRQDNKKGDAFNLVGFQTNLKISEQKRVFRMIPGLENAEFIRFGQMHRNTFLATPEVLNSNFQLRDDPNIYFCGQITGVEGYLANIASGLNAGINIARRNQSLEWLQFPETTMIGALIGFVSHSSIEEFQPMKPNFGLLPPLANPVKLKKAKYEAYASRAQKDLAIYLAENVPQSI